MAVKLGNGNWAVKEDKLLAYNDNSGLFFNKEFDFSRGTSATYVAKDGLIKTAGIQPNVVNNGDFSELGSELVTNGDFDTDSNWSKGAGWTISGGKANSDGTSGNLSQTSVVTVNKFFKITITVSDYISGTVEVSAGAAPRNQMTANGTYTFYQKATPNTTFYIISQSFVGSVDNVSVKQVDPNDYWTLGSDWIFGDGKATYGGNSNGNALTQSNLFTVSGRYRVKFTISDIASGQGRIYMSNASLSEVYLGLTYVNNQSYSFDFDATATNDLVIRGYNSGGGQSFSISNITVQQIETDTPRIDFTNDTKGYLLLEPSRTNLITYSEDLTDSSWAKQSGGTGTAPIVTSNNTISPDGTQNADKVVFDKGTGTTTSDLSILSASFTSQSNTASFYVKADSSQRIVVRNSNSFVGYDIGTDWTRIEKTDTGGSIQIGLRDGYGVADVPNTATVYLWGVQVEAADYATSYIPTTGTTATRNADVCNNSGSAQDFNSEEGVLYAEIAALANDGTSRRITLCDGTISNRVSLEFDETSNKIKAFISSNNISQILEYTTSDITQFNKIAIKYKLNDMSIFLNGNEVASDLSGNMPINLNELNFDGGTGGNDLYGKVRNLQVFTEALTDEQLEKLTS